MTSDFTTRFSNEELNQCQSWLLPDISDSKLIPSAEKEASERREQKIKAEKNTAHANTGSSQNSQSSQHSAHSLGRKNPGEPVHGEEIETIEETVAPITAEQLQQITEAAEKEGYQSGYDKGIEEGRQHGNDAGYTEGLLKAQNVVKQQCEDLQHVIDALMIPLQNEQKQLERLMLDMVCAMSKAVVQRELQLDSSQITQLIENAIATIPSNTEKFTLHLNSADVELLQKQLKGIDKEVTYQVNDDLLPGGCRLETKQTVVDISVENRLKTVIEGFLHQQFANKEDHKIDKQTKVDKSKNEIEKETEKEIELKSEKEITTEKESDISRASIKENKGEKE
jgi:flagellar assembly protein FliH